MHPLMQALQQALAQHHQALVALRRDLHQHAELSFKETRTADVIAERLRAAGLDVRTGIAGTGVVGVLHGDRPGRVVAYRADTDALPLDEVVDVPFRSVNGGAMHACGHDGHVAIAVTMAELLAERRRELPGTVVFLFQPAEEVFGGAEGMIAAGVLENPKVESVLGLHLINQFPVGAVVARPGATMASADFFDIEVVGKGGHGAFPHTSIDPITVAAHIVVGLQDLVSREIAAQDAAVMTIGQISAGTKHNIIPEVAHMGGSIRAFTPAIRDQLVERLSAFASCIAQAYRAEATVRTHGDGTPPVVNDVDVTERVRRGAIELFGKAAVLDGMPIMGSDDMSLFLKERPGCYFWVGAGVPGKEMNPHHHPGFEIDERSLDVGLRLALNSVLDALQP